MTRLPNTHRVGMRHTPMGRIAATQPALFWTGLVLFGLAGLCLFGVLLDARTFNGINVWIKPIKFQVSVGLYLVTLAAYFLALPAGADRSVAGRYVVWASIVAGVFEVGYITLQGARGQASHWNFSSGFYVLMYAAMGIGATVMTSAALVQGIMIWRRGRPTLAPALRTALVAGLVMTFVLGTGFGAYMAQDSSHWVGGTHSDAHGLPIFEWSRDGGDLRVAHFFGMHAMHFVPAVGWLVTRALPAATARAAVIAFACLLALLTTATFVQAIHGRPFIA